MEVVRKIVYADMLRPIIDLPWFSKDLQVEVTIIPQVELPLGDISAKSLKGCLKEYANPSLIEQEQYAWEKNVIEKYGHT